MDAIFSFLEDKPFAQWEEVLDRMVKCGPSVVDLLSEKVAIQDRAIQWTSVAALVRIGGERVIPYLLKALHSEWDAPSILAASYLVKNHKPWIIPRLIKTLGPYPVDFNPHLMVRVKAAAALIKMGNYGGVPFLIKLLKDNTPSEDPEREWNENPRLAWEKEEAFQVLKKLAGTDFGFHVDTSLPLQAASADAFHDWWLKNRARIWDQAPPLEDPLLLAHIQSLIQGLASFQARNADGAKYILRNLGPPVFPFLAEAFKNGGSYERFHALEVIAELAELAGTNGDQWSMEVSSALKDKDPTVRTNAARALGALGSVTSLPSLEGALADPDPDVRLVAVDAIGRVGGTDAGRILEMLKKTDISPSLLVETKAALVRISTDNDASFLEEFLLDDLRRRECACQKIIDLLGDDFGFSPGAAYAERAQSVDRIRIALGQWSRINRD